MINTMTPTSEVYRREQHAGPNVHVIKCAAAREASKRASRRDQQAFTAGLSLPYSSVALEGNVHKIKLIKRQMFGRAGFLLLRKRVIHHPA